MSLSELTCIYNYLKSLHFHYLETWVKECVNYCKTNDPGISLNDLKEEVHQQWLCVNLRDVQVASLPPNLSSYEKLCLPGKYAVQVETMVDASCSLYSQLQTFRRVNTDNIKVTKEVNEWEVKSTRCLTLTLSDGVQEVKAMEYQPIPALRLNDPDLLPGFKMLIIGPVMCRRGMIMLKQNNIKICGGEVDTMCTTHSLEAVLVARLNLPELSQDESQTNRGTMETLDQPPVNLPAIEDSVNLEPTMAENDDELLMNIPFEDDMDLDIPTKISEQQSFEKVEMAVSTAEQCSTNYPNSSSMHVNSLAPSQMLEDTFSSPQDVQQSPQNPVIVNCEPFVYLKQIFESKCPRRTQFTVKAVIITLKTKVTIAKDAFNLQAVISDGSLSATVDFASQVLENILGFSPCELSAMLKDKNRNTAIADRIRNAFQKTQQKLISLNCLMKIEYGGGEGPQVVELNEVSNRHLTELKARKLTMSEGRFNNQLGTSK